MRHEGCIVHSLQGLPGAPGMKMYSKDDLLNNNFGDDDVDDDDEDDDFPSNLVSFMNKSQYFGSTGLCANSFFLLSFFSLVCRGKY